MEFLYRLYSNNYFGIGLLMVIAILAFSFLIILFFGKKDEKKRNQAKIKESNEQIIDTSLEAKEDTLESVENISLDKEEKDDFSFTEEPIVLDTIDETSKEENQIELTSDNTYETEDLFKTNNIILNTDYINEEPTTNDTNADTNFDIYNLDSIMNEEKDHDNEESIDEVLNKYDDIKEVEEPVFTPAIEEKEEENIFTIEEEPKKGSPTPFSSVYLTKEEKKNVEPTINEEVVKEPVVEEKIITPRRPTFDLPKRVDLPKRNDTIINENIIDTAKLDNHANNIFDNIEEDTYTIDK